MLDKLFSAIDSAKRILADRLANPVQDIKRTVARAGEDITAFDKKIQAGGPVATEAMLNAVLNTMPGTGLGGAILMHGGPQEVAKPVASLLNQGIFGPGFYTTNKVFTPHTFAKKTGRISVYDFPDELLAATMKVNSKPTEKYPEFANRLMRLFTEHPEVRQKIIDAAKFQKKGAPEKAAGELVTGDLIESVLRKHFAGNDNVAAELSKVGVPGRTWQYSAERPAEMATLVYPDFLGELKFLGSMPPMQTPLQQRELLNAITGQ